jgi:hypothetical protein
MSSRRRRGSDDAMNLSFLDAVSCGFGAVILLLVLTLIFEPVTARVTRQTIEEQIAGLQDRLAAVDGEITALPVVTVPKPTPAELERLAELQSDLTTIRGQFRASTEPEPESAEEGQLRAARQQLTEEMQRLLANYRPPPNDTTVGGIPVDSEYVIFVIDNSGSMQAVWPTVERVLLETLQVFPRLKGIQVLNNDGRYLIDRYRGKWIPDSRGNRRMIANAMRNWQVFSSSNPTRGLLEALTRYGNRDQRISVYLFGDDFMRGSSVEAVLREVERLNRPDERGRRAARIHGIAFVAPASDRLRYARFLRAVADRNDGTWVALSESDMAPRIRIQGPFGARGSEAPGPAGVACAAPVDAPGRATDRTESDSPGGPNCPSREGLGAPGRTLWTAAPPADPRTPPKDWPAGTPLSPDYKPIDPTPVT